MVYLLKIVIFHGYVSHNQMVILQFFRPGDRPNSHQSSKAPAFAKAFFTTKEVGLALLQISSGPRLENHRKTTEKPERNQKKL